MSATRCPGCGRTLQRRDSGRYARHSVTANSGMLCPLSEMREVVKGHSHYDHERRANLIADLAEIVQDADPSVAWIYLTCLAPDELQRLLMFSLAAIPVDQTVEQMFAWITQLPDAKAAVA